MSTPVSEMDGSKPLFDEPMARRTSWRVGGPADIYFKPSTIEELREFLRSLPTDAPLTWMGLGSNILVRDGGIRGVVVVTTGLEKILERRGENRVRAGAGVSCARLARQCSKWGLGPAAFFAGIPGTVGGALAMNAGAFGGETWDRVAWVETIDRHGKLHRRERSEFEIGYRHVAGLDEQWFTAATFEFSVGDASAASDIKLLLARRNETQPIGQASCGSVFCNPRGAFAGELIERAGLKGRRIGGASVSEKHANFILNDGTATAADIESLIELVQAEVERACGVTLQREVRILGERRRKES
jgi:UDP-N-acetylmuramate dehydrogenase